MAKVYVLFRVLELVDGQKSQIPMGAFATKEDAEAKKNQLMEEMQKLFQLPLVAFKPGRPPAPVAQGGIVAEKLGVYGVTHSLVEMEVQTASAIVVPEPSLIVPG